MAGKNTSVMGILDTRVEVENIIEKLKDQGFQNNDISVLMANEKGTRDFSHEKDTKMPEGVTVGASTGAVIGGTLGWLMGIGTLAVGGLGFLIAAGPIMGLLAGAGAGGAVGGLVGALVGIGIPEYEAKRYEGLIKQGKALVSVHCDSSIWIEKAKDILKDGGATDIASQSEARVPEATDTHTRASGASGSGHFPDEVQPRSRKTTLSSDSDLPKYKGPGDL